MGNRVTRYYDIQLLVANMAGISKGQWVLDAGTGPAAFLAERLAEIVGEKGLVVAVDYEKEYVSKIKEAITGSGFSDMISFVLADLRYVPIRDCSIDAAVSLDMVQNMYGNSVDIEEVVKEYIRESMRIVKLGRRVVVGTRHPVPRNRAQEVYFDLFLFEAKLEYMLWEQQSRCYFEHELTSWLRKAGLEDIESEIVEHNIPYPRKYRIGGIERDNNRLKQIEPYAKRIQLEEKFKSY